MDPKTEQKYADELAKHTEFTIGSLWKNLIDGKTHTVLGMAISHNGENLVLHQCVGGVPLIRATPVNRMHGCYSPKRPD